MIRLTIAGLFLGQSYLFFQHQKALRSHQIIQLKLVQSLKDTPRQTIEKFCHKLNDSSGSCQHRILWRTHRGWASVCPGHRSQNFKNRYWLVQLECQFPFLTPTNSTFIQSLPFYF